MENSRRDTIRGRGSRPESGASPTKSGGGDELHGQDAGMFQFGSGEEATSRAGKASTTMEWIDRIRTTTVVNS